MARPTVGELLREWRHRRNRSQLDLSLDVGVSARHLSFVETGRSRPSPELVLAVAEHLDVPLRERNTMLLAAGYAPRFSETSLDDEAMARVRVSLQRMLDAHDPYPGVVIDRAWNVLLANRAAFAFTDGVPVHLLQPHMNVFRVCLHPEGLAARTNVAQLPPAPEVDHRDEPALLVPFRMLAADGTELSMFTTLTTFGTPRDVTLDELSVELFFPADDETDRVLLGGKELAGV